MELWGEAGECKGGGVVPRVHHLEQDCAIRKLTRLMTGLQDRHICILMIKACYGTADCSCQLIL